MELTAAAKATQSDEPWVSEGFGTADLMEARGVLNELRSLPLLAEAVEEVGSDAGSGSGFGRAARCLAA
jgi:hypothetical protein